MLKGKTPVAIEFNNDGTKMFIIENGGNAEQNITGGKINEYALSTHMILQQQLIQQV